MKLRLPPLLARAEALPSGAGATAVLRATERLLERPVVPDAPRTLTPVAPGAAIEPLIELPPLAAGAPSKERFPEPQGVLQGWWKMATEALRGSSGTREVGRAKKLLETVGENAPRIRAMTDAELRGQTAVYRELIHGETKVEQAALAAAEERARLAPDLKRLDALKDVEKARVVLYRAEQKILDRILPEVFATVREASRRATGMEHYDVQVLGAALMHRGMIAEMYTGEGKTLAATLTAYLNALPGHGYHVATVNDYLARRDAEEMAAIYGYLGMSVGVLQGNLQQMVIEPGKEPKPCERRDAYRADITYATASELGFDYLRDNQVHDAESRVQRPLYGALLDEVDSLLIDEARIPLILAKQGLEPDLKRLQKYDQLARKIHREVVAELDGEPIKGATFTTKDIEWEEHWVSLTDAGANKVILELGMDPFAHGNGNELAFLQDALRAHFNLSENAQYAVVDGKISTVGLSGHLGPGRRFTGGLHQALEAKHGLEVQVENVTSASITMREYLALYLKRAGMTGTAMSARDLSLEVYGLDVARVPTRKPLIRVDYPDKHFETVQQKTERFLEDLLKVHETGRPILVGVEYTHTADWLGAQIQQRLDAKGKKVQVQVLAAKSDAEEARIISRAGRKGAITVATTRGGRGVDIKLGGNPKLIAGELAAAGMSPEQATATAGKTTAKERAEVLSLGGLMVMSFEHLDSRRRDDQLRGRAGRQGEPGATIFYTSLEDPLYDQMRATEAKAKRTLTYDPVRMPQWTERALDSAEGRTNGALSASLPFDITLTAYREKLYQARREALEAGNVRPSIERLIDQAIDHAFDNVVGDRASLGPTQAKELYEQLGRFLPLPPGEPPKKWSGGSPARIRAELDGLVKALMAKRDKSLGPQLARLIDKDAILGSVDDLWGEYLEAMLQLRDGIFLRAYAQKDPKVEFRTEAGQLYGLLMQSVSSEIAARVLKAPTALPEGLSDATEK